MVNIKIVNKSIHKKEAIPVYIKKGDAGVDIRANIEAPIILGSLDRVLIPTGLYLDIPDGFEIQIRPRSGQSLKRGLTVLNTPGTIDSNYTGELGIILINLSKEPQTILPNERVAQLVCNKVETMTFIEVEEITKYTERGDKGFESSGNLEIEK